MVFALDAQQNIVLIREYATGFNDYVLTLPKGVIDPGEDALKAANRELQEEAGFGAHELHVIRNMSAVPNYMGNSLTLVVAQDLYESRLEGDEPEPLEVVKYPLADIETLAMQSDFHEGRAIAALFLVKQWLAEQ
jgi:ADP-ribose diphosphatase